MKTKKIFLLLITVFTFQLAVSQDLYVIVDYMKVKPEMEKEYLEIEKAWKEIHQKRKEMGLIESWNLYRIIPMGTQNEYDYVTTTSVKGWEGIDKARKGWEKLSEGFTEGQKAAFERTEQTRDLIYSQIFALRGSALPSDIENRKPPKYALVNYMKAKTELVRDYGQLEMELFQPVHQESVKMGDRYGWELFSRELPYGAGSWYDAITVDLFDTWEQMQGDNSAAFQKIHPDKKPLEMYREMLKHRTLVKGELNELVDYVN